MVSLERGEKVHLTRVPSSVETIQSPSVLTVMK